MTLIYTNKVVELSFNTNHKIIMKLSHIFLTLILLTGFAMATSTEYEEAEQLFTDKNYDLAYSKASKLAANGDANAMNLVGVMHLYGFGIAGNYENAIKMFIKANAQGSKSAKSNLKDIQDDYKRLLIKHQKEGHKYYQQKLISWLSTTDSKYKDKAMFDGKLYNLPMPAKFVNTYPYNRDDHSALPPAGVSYTLKSDFQDYIEGKETDFLYQMVLIATQDARQNALPLKLRKHLKSDGKLLKFVMNEFNLSTVNQSIKPKDVHSEQVIDKDNISAQFVRVDGFEASLATLVINGKIFVMILANSDPDIHRPVKEDMIEWVDLILEANK